MYVRTPWTLLTISCQFCCLWPWRCRSHPRVLWSQTRYHVLLAVQLRGCKQKEVKLGSKSVELWWVVVPYSLSLHNFPPSLSPSWSQRFRNKVRILIVIIPNFRTFLCTQCRLALYTLEIAIDLMCRTRLLAQAKGARPHHAFFVCECCAFFFLQGMCTSTELWLHPNLVQRHWPSSE